jgi:hypothetical protein
VPNDALFCTNTNGSCGIVIPGQTCVKSDGTCAVPGSTDCFCCGAAGHCVPTCPSPQTCVGGICQ